MKHNEIYSAAELTAFIHEVGFLPLLDSGISGFRRLGLSVASGGPISVTIPGARGRTSFRWHSGAWCGASREHADEGIREEGP